MEGKEKIIKLEYDNESIKSAIDMYNEDDIEYEMQISNYTCKLISDKQTMYFVKHLLRPVVFNITKDLKRYMDANFIEIANYRSRENKYYTANYSQSPFYSNDVYNIDIKAAYPTCLYNSKLIDKKMYDRLMQLNKQERLAAIGMMASSKKVFKLKAGEVLDYFTVESEYSKYFYYCVNTISSLMFSCELIAGDNFIFSWVDGIYVKNKKSAIECRDYLNGFGYDSSIDKLDDFSFKPDRDKITITFNKKGENKLFNIPIENPKISEIINYIHNDK